MLRFGSVGRVLFGVWVCLGCFLVLPEICGEETQAVVEKKEVSGESGEVKEEEFDPQGKWLGTISNFFVKLRLGLVIERGEGGAWGGKLYSIDQGNAEMALDEVQIEGNEIKVRIKSVGGNFRGTWNSKRESVEGKWSQGFSSMSLTLKRVDALPGANRPQVPKKPYPYDEEEVSFVNAGAGISLKGTLTLPRGAGPYPAAVLISGSGPQDRNEALMGHQPFLVLADALTRRGIAVLRYDDRDFGKPGEVFGATSAELSEDAEGAFEFLRKRKEIDARKIGLIGHSEGGLIAPMLAARREEAAFVVMLAGTGVTGEEILISQRETMLMLIGKKPETIRRELEKSRRYYEVVKGETDDAVALKKLEEIRLEPEKGANEKGEGPEAEVEKAQLKMLVKPWFRYFLTYDPCSALGKVKCPILGVIGEKDCQVPPRMNLPPMEASLKAGGNRDYALREMAGLNHLLQPCKTGMVSEYGTIETTMDPAALDLIGGWIAERMSK